MKQKLLADNMPDSTEAEHNTDTAQIKDHSQVTEDTEVSQSITDPATSFKAKLSQFAYRQDSHQNMPASVNSRILRSANPKVSLPVVRKVSKPLSSRSSSQDPSEDVKLAKIDPPTPPTKATKRKSDAISMDVTTKAPVAKKPRTKKSSSSSVTTSIPLVNNLKDSVRPGLILISVGVNPGKLTGQLGT